ncbi:steroid receptor RNA activator 1 [Aricia agestis]|uniref:steroid receptor RNA activator 1 n=1 Tax=Aricia agestis TaxID=91739 RepID=UPI001C204810|nr:steroid receptor RNA activator 1 [Aricia agestis]
MEGCNTPVASEKAAYDPGWNDPPSIAYNAQQTTPNRPRNFLNKRVAFPLSGNASNPVSSPPVNLPPLPGATLPPPLTTNAVPKNNDTVQVDTNTLVEVKNILSKILEDSSELGSKVESVKKKLSILEEMWANGKLNTQVQIQMKDLAYALRDDAPSKADIIHKALMVDHVSEVSSWMPGVRQLIYNCLARSELLAIDKEE